MAKSVRFARRKRSSFKKRRAQIGKKSQVARVRRSRRRVKVMRGGAGKNILLIIDPQKGFFAGGPLAVPNAENDLNLLISFLQSNPDFFPEIHVSLDSHTNTHIAHAGFWQTTVIQDELKLKDDKIVNGNNEDCNANKIDQFDPTPFAKRYIELMGALSECKTSSKPTPRIWPTHCIKPDADKEQKYEDVATGWALYEPLKSQLDSMAESNTNTNTIKYHEKGTNDLVEMYSIFSAEVPFIEVYKTFEPEYREKIKSAYPGYFNDDEEADVPDEVTGKFRVNTTPNYNTQFNLKLFKQLFGEPTSEFNKVYICGEAKTHCVKTTIEDLYNTIQHGRLNADNVLRKATYSSDELKTILENIHIIDNVSSSIVFEPPISIFVDPMQKSFLTMQQNGVKIVEIKENQITDSSVIRAGNDNFPSIDFK